METRTFISLMFITGLAITGVGSLNAEDGDMLKAGEKAPDFSLPDSRRDMRSLGDFLGTPTLIFFYPKDHSPGCTKEACTLRDNYSRFREYNIDIVGISYDSPESHAGFKEKYNLPFTLLSDSEKTVAKAYGASRGVLNFIGAKRISYLLDDEGIVMKVYPDVTPTDHADEILSYFETRKK